VTGLGSSFLVLLADTDQPVEQAAVLVFLASHDASYVTGEIYGATGKNTPVLFLIALIGTDGAIARIALLVSRPNCIHMQPEMPQCFPGLPRTSRFLFTLLSVLSPTETHNSHSECRCSGHAIREMGPL